MVNLFPPYSKSWLLIGPAFPYALFQDGVSISPTFPSLQNFPGLFLAYFRITRAVFWTVDYLWSEEWLLLAYSKRNTVNLRISEPEFAAVRSGLRIRFTEQQSQHWHLPSSLLQPLPTLFRLFLCLMPHIGYLQIPLRELHPYLKLEWSYHWCISIFLSICSKDYFIYR